MGPAGVSGAIGILTTMFPDAKFTPGTEPQKLVAWARPVEHKKIEAAVAEISSKEPPEKAHRMVVYTLESTGPGGVSSAIRVSTRDRAALTSLEWCPERVGQNATKSTKSKEPANTSKPLVMDVLGCRERASTRNPHASSNARRKRKECRREDSD